MNSSDVKSFLSIVAAAVKIEQRTQDIVTALKAGRRVGRGQKVTTIMNNGNIQQLSIGLINRPGPLNQAILRFLRAASHVMGGMIHEFCCEDFDCCVCQEYLNLGDYRGILNCWHNNFCYICACDLQLNLHTCPFCRCPITSVTSELVD